MGCCNSGGDAGAESRALEAERQSKITEGMGKVNQVFSGFGPDFYKRRAKDYIAYALPKLGQETRETGNAATYSLANRGLLKSGAGNTLRSSLGRATAEAQAGIGSEAQTQSQNLQKEVESQRANIVAQLQASGDPTFAAQQALSAASQFSAPSSFAPVGGFLQNWANLWLANKQASALNNSTSMYNNRSMGYGVPSAASYSVR